MRRTMPISMLPNELRVEDAVDAACADDIAYIEERLRRGTSVLVEADKEMSLYLFMGIRQRLRGGDDAPRLVIVDGRPRGVEGEAPSNIGRMIQQLTDAIRGSVERSIICLLHLDVLTTTNSSLSPEAKETIPLLYENPEACVLGFRDPSFELPKTIADYFPIKREIIGVPRDALPKIITQREARTMHHEEFDPFGLYKYVSGLNPVRCRKVFEALTLRREAPPGRPQHAAVYREIRRSTVKSDVDLPNVDLEKDIGGYAPVKERLQEELIDLIRAKDEAASEADVQQIESLLPRGIIFYGPPGTGKTYFAKAIATSVNATIHIVSGPELKSKWVGESEENLRRVFRQARQSAPSVVVFDEIDAFATARGTYQGSGVEHSMVNQLLTEMDGFRKNEMVFIVGTTNFLESVDPALLRPGRFEFLIEIPSPDPADREAIAKIYNEKLETKLDDKLISHLVRRTEGYADRVSRAPFTGDHIYAVFRALKRQALRTGNTEFTRDDIDKALSRKSQRSVSLSDEEERVVANHEAGHAMLGILLEHARPPERIAIAQDQEGALGYVIHQASAKPYAMTAKELRAEICVGLGGMVAERMVFGDSSIGAFADLQQATRLARAMVLEYGMDSEIGPVVQLHENGRLRPMSETLSNRVDEAVERILREELQRAEATLHEHKAKHAALTELLLEKKVLDSEMLSKITTSS